MRSRNPPDGSGFDYSGLSPVFRGLSKPAQRALVNSAIFTADDLAQWTRADVANLHGIGPSAFPKLDAALSAAGRTFKTAV